MKCFNPIKVPLSEEAKQMRQQRLYLPLEERFANYINVPCGKCAACLARKRSDWSFRLHHEVKCSSSCYFITLTYDDLNVPIETCADNKVHEVVSKEDVQLFMKRLRKSIEPYKIRYFLVSEYGPKTLRPHYHMLLFNFPLELKHKLTDYVYSAWSFGFIRCDPVTPARIHYVTSYCLDYALLPSYLPKNFMLCSRRPGLGSAYLDNDKFVKYHHDTLDGFGHISTNGTHIKTKLPRYLSDKLFSDDERVEINNKFVEFHNEERSKLLQRHKEWMKAHGYTFIGDGSVFTPPGSPLFVELQKQKIFEEKVKSKCKNKKNG